MDIRCYRSNFSFGSSMHRAQLQPIMTLFATTYTHAFNESKGAGNEPSFAAVYLYPPICHARVSIAIAQYRPLFAARIKLASQAFAGHALSLCISYDISRHSVSFNK